MSKRTSDWFHSFVLFFVFFVFVFFAISEWIFARWLPLSYFWGESTPIKMPHVTQSHLSLTMDFGKMLYTAGSSNLGERSTTILKVFIEDAAIICEIEHLIDWPCLISAEG